MKRFLRIVRSLAVAVVLCALLGGLAAGAGYFYLAPTLPDVDALRDVDYQVPLRVYSAEKKLIAEFGERRRIPVTLDDVPQTLVDAFIAAEDQRFYVHPGVDYQGIIRAIWYLVRTGEKGPGGSTITMQVARNFFLTREQTYLRKAREILLALKIERALSKEQILELYFNKIYLGQRAYGVGAAARIYYGRPVAELDLAQAAMIAGLPKAPSLWNPIANPGRALERRAYVLGRMLEQGFIGQDAYDQAMAAPVTASLRQASAEVEAPYVAEMARQMMVERYGDEAAYTEGYSVYTTVNAAEQAAANGALREALHEYDERHGWRGPVDHIELTESPDLPALRERLATYPRVARLTNAVVLGVNEDGASLLTAERDAPWELPFAAMEWAREFLGRNSRGPAPEKPADVLAVGDVVRLRDTPDGPRLAQVPEPSGALVAISPKDGRVRSLVGGYDFGQSKFNRVTQAERQPGSSFKPFIYSAALANGFTPATLVNDAPVVFEDAALESTWRPENYSGRFFGPTRLREALIHSRNLVSIRVLRRIGVSAGLDHLERFGFARDALPHNLSLALGSASITPMQLVRGYAVFANGGYRIDPWVVERIVGDDGDVVFEAEPPTVCEGDACPGAPAEGAAPQATEVAVTEPATDLDADTGPPAAPRALPATNAWLITSMMRDVVKHGTGRRALKLGRDDLAGKTGTTNDQRDAWFAGFNHAVVTAAWVGFDQVQPLGGRETGSTAALPMWIDYMRVALDGVPEAPRPQPDGLVTVRIDRESGLVTGADNPKAIFETFRAGNVPERGERAASSADGGGGSASSGGGGSSGSLF